MINKRLKMVGLLAVVGSMVITNYPGGSVGAYTILADSIKDDIVTGDTEKVYVTDKHGDSIDLGDLILGGMGEIEEEEIIEDESEIRLMALNGIVDTYGEEGPINVDGRVLVPLSYIMNAFGATSEYDSINETVVVKSDGKQTTFYLNSVEYTSGLENKEMDTIPYIKDNTIYIPIKYVFDVLDTETEWNNTSKVVYVGRNVNRVSDTTLYGYNLGDELGELRFKSKYRSGLQLIPGGVYKDGKGSSVDFWLPNWANREEVKADLVKELGMFDGVEDILEYIITMVDYDTELNFGNTRYKVSKQVDNSIYVKVYDDRSVIKTKKVSLSSVNDEISLDGIKGIVGVDEDIIYVPIVETAKAFNYRVTGSIWGDKLIFSNDMELDIPNRGYKIGLGLNESIDDKVILIDNKNYVSVGDFNSMFMCQLSGLKDSKIN